MTAPTLALELIRNKRVCCLQCSPMWFGETGNNRKPFGVSVAFASPGHVTTQGRRPCKETEAQRGDVAEQRTPSSEPPYPTAAFAAPTPGMETV